MNKALTNLFNLYRLAEVNNGSVTIINKLRNKSLLIYFVRGLVVTATLRVPRETFDVFTEKFRHCFNIVETYVEC